MPLSLTNTFLAMSIDAETRRPRLSNVTGGLSGPAIKPIALRMVYEAARAVSIPILGMGGITTAEDTVEFLLAGATAVQVGTASYADPRAVERLARGLESWCRSHDVERSPASPARWKFSRLPSDPALAPGIQCLVMNCRLDRTEVKIVISTGAQRSGEICSSYSLGARPQTVFASSP